MTSPMRSVPLLTWLLLLVHGSVLPAGAQELGPTTLTVDDDGGADFTDLAPAVAAAREGDLILVAAGHYSGFAIFNQSLHVVADGSGPVTVAGTIHIEDLIGPQQVLLRGLASANGEPPLVVSARTNLGRILIEDCYLGPRGAALSPFPGLLVQSVTSLAVVRSTIVGGTLPTSPSSGGLGQPGLRSIASNVWCYHSTFVGGAGAGPGGDGGPGIESANFELFCGSCLLEGGPGGPGVGCDPAGSGGNGLDQLGFVTNVRWRATRAVGGAGGAPGCPSQPSGPPGVARFDDGLANSFAVIGRETRGFEVDAPVIAGQPLTLRYEAPSTDGVLTFASIGQNVEQAWELGGVKLLLLPAETVYAGPIPRDGLLALLDTGALVPPGHASATLYLQSLFVPEGLAPVVLGPVSSAVVLATVQNGIRAPE